MNNNTKFCIKKLFYSAKKATGILILQIFSCTIVLKEVIKVKDILQLDITNIQIIVHKKESEGFVFDNPRREFDGFIMFTSGNGYVTAPNGKCYEVSKGDMVLANSGDNYKIEFKQPCSYVTSGIALDTDKALLPFIHKCNKKEYDEIVDICECWQSRSWDSYAKCRIKLMNFYLSLFSNNILSKAIDYDIEKALNYIHNNFKKNFSGSEISEFCSLSLSYLRNKFLKQTGYTIVEYRDSLRIAAAKEMLASHYFTVAEIAAELGYCDTYHFSKKFKQHTGISPLTWLKKQ